MKDLSPRRQIHWIHIQRDQIMGMLCLSQRGYLKKVVERFKMHHHKL